VTNVSVKKKTQPDDKYKGYILRALKKKNHVASKGVHGVKRVKHCRIKFVDDYLFAIFIPSSY
jgi:hypothetical protein